MSGIGALSQIPVVDERGFMTQPWFRFITGSSAITPGGANQVLHGNSGGGYPTWSAVDLTADVIKVLPIANGGTGGVLDVSHGGTGVVGGNSGGVLSFIGTTALISSGPLTKYGLVVGGGPGGVPASLANLGTSNQVLHGNSSGLPTWSAVDLTADVINTLPIANGGTGGLLDVAHGGTGVTTSTGTGNVVLSSAPSISNPSISGGAFSSPVIANVIIGGPLLWSALAPFHTAHLNGADCNVTSVGGSATTILSGDASVGFIVHDQTSGGMALGLMDTVGGLLMPAAFNNITGITFTRAAGVGLQANVTAGANPRSLSVFGIKVGA